MRIIDPRQPLSDALESIDHIYQYFGNNTVYELENDDFLFDAIAMRLQIIGESVNKIPQNYKDQFPDIPWQEIVALRNYISHAYSYLDAGRFYQIIKEDLPKLETVLKVLFKQAIEQFHE